MSNCPIDLEISVEPRHVGGCLFFAVASYNTVSFSLIIAGSELVRCDL